MTRNIPISTKPIKYQWLNELKVMLDKLMTRSLKGTVEG